MLKFHITPDVIDQLRQTLGGDGEMAREWIEIYKQNAEEQLAEALIDQLGISIANSKIQQRPIEGVGQCMLQIAPKLNTWLHSYCPGFVYDEAFIKKLIEDNQHLCLQPGYLRKAQIIRPDFTATSTQPPQPIVLPDSKAA
jgi:hypothetical protein